jgi:hypothetical protein
VGSRQERGRRYRNLMQRMVYHLKIKAKKDERHQSRLLFISGVLSNVEDFARWLTGNKVNGITIRWRPIEKPELSEIDWNGKQFFNQSTSEPLLLPKMPLPPQLTLANDLSYSYVVAVAQLAIHSARTEPTMLFSASKRFIKSEDLLVALKSMIEPDKEFGYDPLPSHVLRDQRYSLHYDLLEMGVAIHHNDLPILLRREVENRIYKERARLVLASPTLAQGVNLPILTVLVCGLSHGGSNAEIDGPTFWNVVGRVGRPLPLFSHDIRIVRPKIWFLIDKQSLSGKRDVRIKNHLLRQYDKIRVSCGLLDFLLRMRQLWNGNHGNKSMEILFHHLAENDLSWIKDKSEREKYEEFLQDLDDRLRNLSNENFAGNLEDLLQDTTGDLINLLQGTEEIKPDDLAYIKEAVLARAKFVSKSSADERRQDYLLGLPARDCAVVRAHQDDLLNWYRAATEIFAVRLEVGLEGLSRLMEFVSLHLSIADNKYNDDDEIPLADNLPLFDLAAIPTQSDHWREVHKSWVHGDEEGDIVDLMQKIDRKTDFYRYHESMFEYVLPWGISALSRFLADLARERGLPVVKDGDFLSSLVRYGVPSPMACYLVRLEFSRVAARKIWERYVSRATAPAEVEFDFDPGPDDLLPLAESTILYLKVLSDEDISELKLKETDIENLRKIRAMQ